MNFYVIANIAGAGFAHKGMSGGDRIALKFINRWAKEADKVKVFIGKSGQEIYKLNALKNVQFTITHQFFAQHYSYLRLFFFEILILIKAAKEILNIKPSLKTKNIVYSASDFWPDALPAFIMKFKNPEIKWIAGFYLFAPKPWQKDSPYKGKRWPIGLVYYLTQTPIYWIVNRYADMVFVTSEPDREKFINRKRTKDRVVVVRGGVDIEPAKRYLASPEPIPVEMRKYDAVFIGRFHHQKGIFELIDIWKLVSEEKPKAKLAIVGMGYFEAEMSRKIKRLNLENNIELLGFKDGEEKYQIFKQSKIVVHPATYDSGGMAACEAMVWGLPGVSFDLEALKTYYPKGMLKTACYDLPAFAENIIRLLENEELYQRMSQDAVAWAKEWDWDKRTEEIVRKIKETL